MAHTVLKIGAFISLLFTISSTHAAFITYTDRVAWEAAVAGFVEEDFTGDDGSFDGASLDVGDFTLTGDSTAGFTDMVISGGEVTGNVCGVCGIGFGYEMTFDFPILGFGADYFSVFSSSGITLTTDFETIGSPVNSDGFFGFITDTAFTTITVTGNDEIHIFDRAVYTAASQVPAPATLGLFGLGLAGLGWLRRERVRNTSSL